MFDQYSISGQMLTLILKYQIEFPLWWINEGTSHLISSATKKFQHQYIGWLLMLLIYWQYLHTDKNMKQGEDILMFNKRLNFLKWHQSTETVNFTWILMIINCPLHHLFSALLSLKTSIFISGNIYAHTDIYVIGQVVDNIRLNNQLLC